MSKKILHIIDNIGLGGAQIMVKGIFEGQIPNNDIFLFSVRKTKIITDINHKNIILNNSSFKYCFPIFKLKKIIKDNHIEIIHCHLAKSQIIGGFLKTLFFPNIKLVFHEHGEIFEDGKTYIKFMNFFKEKIDIFLAVSNLTKQKLKEKTKIKKEKIIVLYNFVDLKKFKKIPKFDIKSHRQKYLLEKNDFVIGFAARLIERKGWFEFVQAAKILKDKGYEFKYLIAGDGKDKQKINDFIKKNSLEENIKMIGYVENMNEFYNTINVFVFPSHIESLGLTGLEANASSCPLIASNIKGLNEIIINNQNAIVFKKENINDLVLKIIKMYEDGIVKKNLIKGGLIEVKKYSLEKYLEKLEKIYE